MPGIFEQSFLDDMNDSYLTECIMGGYGPVIDHLCEQTVERVGLFESAEDKERRNRMIRILEGDENYEQETDHLHGHDDIESTVDDWDLIDSVMGDNI